MQHDKKTRPRHISIKGAQNALHNAESEKGLNKIRRFLREAPCPECKGTRLSKAVRATTLAGKNLAEATALTLDELLQWVDSGPATLSPELMRMTVRKALPVFSASGIHKIAENLSVLQDLGLGYLTLGEDTPALSGGERSGSNLPPKWEKRKTMRCLYLMNRLSDCIRLTCKCCLAYFTGLWKRAQPLSLSSTTSMLLQTAITSSIWDRAEKRTGEKASHTEHLKKLPKIPPVLPAGTLQRF